MICKALAQTAGDQKGVTSPSPEPPVPEADSWKIEEPVVKPKATSTNSEKEAGWSGEIVGTGFGKQREHHLLPPGSRYTFEVQPGDKIIVPERIF